MKTIRVTAAAAIMAAIAPALPHVSGGEALAQDQCGRASWYALTSMTASGERMDPAKLTAAHRNLGFGGLYTIEVANAPDPYAVTGGLLQTVLANM